MLHRVLSSNLAVQMDRCLLYVLKDHRSQGDLLVRDLQIVLSVLKQNSDAHQQWATIACETFPQLESLFIQCGDGVYRWTFWEKSAMRRKMNGIR